MFGFVRRGLILFGAAFVAAAIASAPVHAQPGEYGASTGGLFIISYTAGPNWREGAPMSQQPGMRAHGEYITGLFAEGLIFAAGPYMQDDGVNMGEGGLIIVRAENREAVDAIVAADPAVTGGLFVPQVSRWWPRFRTGAPLPQ